MGKVRDRINSVLVFKEDFVDKLNVLFGRWGTWAYDNPYKIIIVSLIVSVVPAIGFIPPMARWVDGADNLYALPVSEARNQGLVLENLFQGGTTRANFIIMTSQNPGENLLTWDFIERTREIDEIIRGKRVDSHTDQLVGLPATPAFYPEWYSKHSNESTPDKSILRFDDICAPDPLMGCRVQNIFEMGIDDMKLMLKEDDPVEFWAFDGLVFNTKRKGFAPEVILGNMTSAPCTREVPTSLVSQIYSEDRYSPGSKEGYSKVELTCIQSALAFHFIYETQSKPEYLERQMAWEYQFYDLLQRNRNYGGLTLGANAFRSRDDELSKSTAETSDIIFVLYTFILLISYTTLINFNCDQYRNKATSSLAGSISSLLGLYAGLGLPGLCGVAFVPTALVVPFLVMGVGADDIFVIVSSYALAYGEDSPRQRCAVCLRGCGVSVLMTTVTNVIAFAIGIQSPYLSIKNFCIFTLCGLAASLIYELTFFFAVLCLEARKEEAQKACLCGLPPDECERKKFDINNAVSTYQVVGTLVEEAAESIPHFRLVPIDPGKKTGWWEDFCNRGSYWFTPEDLDTADVSTEGGKDTDASGASSPSGEQEVDSESVEIVPLKRSHPVISPTSSTSPWRNLLPNKQPVNRFALNPKLMVAVYRSEPSGNVGKKWRRFFVTLYCRWLLNRYVKVFVLLLFTVNFGITCFGFTKLNQGLEMRDLSPDDSYLKTYDDMYAEYFSNVDLPVEVFYPERTPWHEKRVMDTLRRFVATVNNRPENFLLNDPMTRMYDDESLAPGLRSENETEFYQTLRRALVDPDSAYKQFELDFVWDGDRLLSFRQQLIPSGTTSSRERAHWMLTFRADSRQLSELPDSEGSHPITAMLYNYMLVFYESDIQIMASVISSVTCASMAMFVVALMLIPDLGSGTVVIAIMLLIDATIIGYMAFWEVNLNMISMVILVISIGFAVDYSAHICYAFVNAIGPSRDLRVTEAIVLVGTPLFHGATSNFLGIMLLGFSSSYILRIFFKMMTLVVLFGIAHGMILLPVLLSLWGKMSGSKPVTVDSIPQDKKHFLRASKSGMTQSGKSDYEALPLSAITTKWYKDGYLENEEADKKSRSGRRRAVDFLIPSEDTPLPRRK